MIASSAWMRSQGAGLALTLGRYSDCGSSSFGAVRLEADGSFTTGRLPPAAIAVQLGDREQKTIRLTLVE